MGLVNYDSQVGQLLLVHFTKFSTKVVQGILPRHGFEANKWIIASIPANKRCVVRKVLKRIEWKRRKHKEKTEAFKQRL